MVDRPTGTVTFLFTDVEGSSRLVEWLGERYRDVQGCHDTILRAAFEEGDGVEVSTEGDSFFAVFPTPAGAVRAAVQAQRELAATPWPEGAAVRVRMGLHTGEGILGGDSYLGLDVNGLLASRRRRMAVRSCCQSPPGHSLLAVFRRVCPYATSQNTG